MKFKITFLLLFIFGFTLQAQDNWNTLAKDNYSINYPSDWSESDQKPQPSVQFLLTTAESSLKEDNFRESINMVTESLQGQIFTPESYAKLSIDQIKLQIPDAKIISNKNVDLGDEKAREVIWSNDFGNGTILQFKQVFVLKNNTAYVLTYSATEQEYNDYLEVADKIIYSFKLIK
ncbi:PsbP-related protein [Winogradskyella sp.]|uniref:PsbP-related protein n=1 Tax=Winogradskyella sp. TaxID=1883156 RepID=UPI003F6A90C1